MRARFFNEVRSCRRRPQIPVEDTPVGRFLTNASELGLLHRRAIATRIRFALANKGLRIADGFAAMDRSREGSLSPAELSKGMEWLGLKLCPRCAALPASTRRGVWGGEGETRESMHQFLVASC